MPLQGGVEACILSLAGFDLNMTLISTIFLILGKYILGVCVCYNICTLLILFSAFSPGCKLSVITTTCNLNMLYDICIQHKLLFIYSIIFISAALIVLFAKFIHV